MNIQEKIEKILEINSPLELSLAADLLVNSSSKLEQEIVTQKIPNIELNNQTLFVILQF